MIIQRETEAGNFHVARDEPFLDDSLSWEARGVLAYLFTKPDDWTPRMYDLVNNAPCEKYKIKSIFEELQEAGYLHRRKFRADDGTFDWQVKIFDHPRSDPGWEEPTPNGSHPEENGGYNNTDTQSDGQSTNTECEGAPAREEDPAVAVYHEVMPRRASNFQQDKIAQTVDDVDRWQDVVEEWRLADYNPGNLRGMLDVYENGWDDDRDEDEEYNDLRDFEPRWHG
jgi:hypothetical protein